MKPQEKINALSDIEGDVCDTLMAVTVLHELVETDAGRVFEQTKDGENFATVMINREEAERLMWMAGDCLHRIKALHKAYYAALEA